MKIFYLWVFIIALILLGGFASHAWAAGEMGNARGYGWSSNAGWISFKSHGPLASFTELNKPIPFGPVKPFGFQQKGDYIFHTDSQSFYAYDISADPANPVLVDKITYSVHSSSDGLSGFDIFGDYAFVAGGSGATYRFYVFDISDPDPLLDPLGVGLVEVVTIDDLRLKGAWDVVISEDGLYAYVYTGFSGNIVVIDILSPATPTILGEIVNGQRAMTLSGDYLYTSWTKNFTVRKIAGAGGDAVNPPIVGEITWSDPGSDKLVLSTSVAVAGSYAYVASYQTDQVTVVDIFDPTNPRVVGWIKDSVALDNVAWLSVVDGFAYATIFVNVAPGYLTVLDVADPENPVVATTLSLPSAGGGMSESVVTDDYVYTAGWEHVYAIEVPHRYAVSVDRTTGYFSGYAWNPTTGWISFNRAETGPPPFDDICLLAGECTAKLDIGGTNEVSGWARALVACKDNLWDGAKCTGPGAGDKAGGWDGWIKFRGTTGAVTPYGVNWNPATEELEQWAWGDEVVGWVSFNCLNQGTCGVSDYKVFVYIPNSAPNQPSSLAEDAIECVNPPAVKLSWTYTDPEGDPQDAYQIQLKKNFDDFTSPDFDTCDPAPGTCASGNSSNLYTAQGNTLDYNSTYYWQVKVWDTEGQESPWSLSSSFATAAYAYPDPSNFSPPPPTAVSANQLVQFDDCAGGCNPFASASMGKMWSWDFDGDGVENADIADPEHTYTSVGSFPVTLTLEDDVGSCSATKSLTVTLPFPGWREISPF